MTKLLFVCSANRLRSPTAERIFSGRDGLEVTSAGTATDAERPLTADMVEWADIIFVMEKSHLNRVRKRFKAHLQRARIVCLHIPDEFEFMDPMLVQLLATRVPRYLPADFKLRQPAAGVTDRLWEVADIVALVDAAEARPAKRGRYKVREAD